jgi:hypothetical protein
MNERRRTVTPEAVDEPTNLARREAQIGGRLVDRQLAGHHVGKDDDALLCPSVQLDLPRLAVTESLAP